MKKFNIKIIATLLFVSLSALIFLYKDSWQSTSSQAANLAIPVVLAYNSDETLRSSAVHIGNGYFLTAAHILSRDQTQMVLETNLGQSLVADLVWSAEQYDISLFYSEDFDSVSLDSYRLDCTPLMIGNELRFIGNAEDAPFITVWGRVSTASISVENMWKKTVTVDASIIPGMSGGAAVDDRNRLRGIIVGTLKAFVAQSPFGPQSSFTGISYIVESSDICLLMEQN